MSGSTSMFFERMEPKILFSADALSGLVTTDPFANDDDACLDINESVTLLCNAFDTDAELSDNSTIILMLQVNGLLVNRR